MPFKNENRWLDFVDNAIDRYNQLRKHFTHSIMVATNTDIWPYFAFSTYPPTIAIRLTGQHMLFELIALLKLGFKRCQKMCDVNYQGPLAWTQRRRRNFAVIQEVASTCGDSAKEERQRNSTLSGDRSAKLVTGIGEVQKGERNRQEGGDVIISLKNNFNPTVVKSKRFNTLLSKPSKAKKVAKETASVKYSYLEISLLSRLWRPCDSGGTGSFCFYHLKNKETRGSTSPCSLRHPEFECPFFLSSQLNKIHC